MDRRRVGTIIPIPKHPVRGPGFAFVPNGASRENHGNAFPGVDGVLRSLRMPQPFGR
jgi:hypothetical protein